MNRLGTTYEGPLGSTIHVLRADADTIAALAEMDWSRRFRRVRLDPVSGLITLMSPSHLHESLSGILDRILDVAGSMLAGAAQGLRQTRLRAPGDPPGTGMEADCAFYFGERARAFRATLVESDEAAEAFLERNAPDLVVEVEVTNADEGKVERYAALGVREMWRLHGSKGNRELSTEFLALDAGQAPKTLDASALLPGLTSRDVCEAVDGVRSSDTDDERAAAVARIVSRRRRDSLRVREDEPPYATAPRPDPGASG